jgi:hypothetical protein
MLAAQALSFRKPVDASLALEKSQLCRVAASTVSSSANGRSEIKRAVCAGMHPSASLSISFKNKNVYILICVPIPLFEKQQDTGTVPFCLMLVLYNF